MLKKIRWYQVVSLGLLIVLLLPMSPIRLSKQYGSEYDKTLVSLTFDDGYGSWVSEADPILQKYNLPATGFVNDPDYSGSESYLPGDTNGETKFSRQDIRNLYESGWEIGWHTAGHINLKNISKNEMVDSLCGWEEMFNSLSLPEPSTFAYPEGVYTRYAVGIAEDCFFAARTTDPGINTPKWVHSNPAKLKLAPLGSKDIIDSYIGDGVFLVFLMHTVDQVAKWQSETDISTAEFEELCRFLSHREIMGEIDVVTFKRGVELMNERDSTSRWNVRFESPFKFTEVLEVPIPNRYLLVVYSVLFAYPELAGVLGANVFIKVIFLLLVLGAIGFIVISIAITTKDGIRKFRLKQ